MLSLLKKIRYSFVFKLILTVGTTLLLCLSGWGYFNVRYQKERAMQAVFDKVEELTQTITLETHHVMMHDLKENLNEIIRGVGDQKDLENIRIYNKNGEIKFSKVDAEVETRVEKGSDVCAGCHRADPPQSRLSAAERTRIFNSDDGYRLLGLISPIYTEPGCASNACHAHPPDQKVLGVMDVVVSLKEIDASVGLFAKRLFAYAVFIFLITSAMILFIVLRFVRRPIKKMVDGTRRIALGDYLTKIDVSQEDELGQLSEAIEKMGQKIAKKKDTLNKQRYEYQNLFEQVPCIISVQDRNFRLIRYNKEFEDKFSPRPGDFCFSAYKGRVEKCPTCPVEKTFEDGLAHFSEEAGFNKHGEATHWIVHTSPIKNAEGQVVAAMEMSIDITPRKLLEEKLDLSEKKYFAIFDNIPNPVFVLDKDSLEILDCNESVRSVYGYTKEDIIEKSFLNLFRNEEKERYGEQLKTSAIINQAKHINKAGETVFVTIRVSPSEYPGKKVLLVTTSDITKRLETEQQLIQAGKMATLGEMATGIAHEINQPLTVIKTASNYIIKKINKNEAIEGEILSTMAHEIDSHVDRASRIINHMREFGRKTDMVLERVQVNDIIKRAFDILGQQLRARGIEVAWHLEPDLPEIMADPGRLEQVFINLLINARDALDEKWRSGETQKVDKRIDLMTRTEEDMVVATVSDTGPGIAEVYLEKIFEPFFTTKEVVSGTGLGLSISYGIVQEFSGSIVATTVKGGGASFIIRFPIPKDR